MGGSEVSTTRAFSLVFVLALLATAGCSATSRVSDVQRLQAQNAYERGLRHLTERQLGPALSALQEATTLDPEVAIYQDTLGVVLLDLGQLDRSLQHLRRAVDLDPKMGDARFHLGTALAEGRRWDEAVEEYRTALALPSITVSELAYQNLGLALYNLKRYPEAEQALRFALTLDANLQGAYYNLGLVMLAQGRGADARAVFQRARQLGPESPFGQAAAERLRALGEGG